MQVLCVSVMWVAAGSARAQPPSAADPSEPWTENPAPDENAAPEGRAAPPVKPTPQVGRVQVAFGTNLPFLWKDGDTVAASLYVGMSEHHAIRANVASYKSHGPMVGDAIGGILFNSDGSEASFGGRTTDLGIGWVYYPRSLWDGLMLEAGALRRARDVSVDDSNRTPERVATTTTVYAARAMIGWSWLLGRHVFIATGVGLSVGHESGSETLETEYPAMTTREHVSRVDVSAEAYLRMGAAFDL